MTEQEKQRDTLRAKERERDRTSGNGISWKMPSLVCACYTCE